MIRQTLLKTALILALPAIELLSLRLYLKYGLDLRIGFRGTTDYDYFIPVPLAAFIFIYCLEKAKPVILDLRLKTVAMNLAAIAAFVGLNHWITGLPEGAEFPTFLWGSLLFAIIVTSLCLLVSPKELVKNPNAILIIPCLFIAFLFPFYLNSFDGAAKSFGHLTENALKAIGGPLLPDTAVIGPYYKKDVLAIRHSVMHIEIGKGCIGLEGTFLFTLFYLIFATINGGLFSIGRWIALFVPGLILMFATNLVRILTLFWIGIALKTVLGEGQGTIIFRFVAHTHIGWMLYASVTVGYFILMTRFASTQSTTSPAKGRLRETVDSYSGI